MSSWMGKIIYMIQHLVYYWNQTLRRSGCFNPNKPPCQLNTSLFPNLFKVHLDSFKHGMVVSWRG